MNRFTVITARRILQTVIASLGLTLLFLNVRIIILDMVDSVILGVIDFGNLKDNFINAIEMTKSPYFFVLVSVSLIIAFWINFKLKGTSQTRVRAARVLINVAIFYLALTFLGYGAGMFFGTISKFL